MKTDSNGAMTWWQTYHKSSYANPVTLVQTTDGGYALAGINREDSGFVSLVKTDGNGGFALAGTTNDGTGLDGGEDVYLMKIAENGTEEWQLIFDEILDEEWATDLIQTVDGEFVFTGYVGSRVGLVKTDRNGLMIWNHIYGRSGEDVARAVIQTVDEGFVIAGSTSSLETGNSDAWLIKTDENGMIEWNRTYGGLEDDGAETIIQTADEGFVFAGFTRSYGAGDSGAWLIKTDKNGIIEWNQTYGGELDEKVLRLYQLTNGNYAMLGYYGQYWVGGMCDTGPCWHEDLVDNAWLLITDENGLFQQEFIYEIPEKVRFHDFTWSDDSIRIGGVGENSLFLLKIDLSGVYQWNTTSQVDETLIFTSDGGFVLGGRSDYDGQYYLIKMDSNGLTQWELTSPTRIIGDSSIIQTTDGGYTLAGGV
jgi:hypothetical protein